MPAKRPSMEGVVMPAAMKVPAKVISLMPAKPVIIIGLLLPADDLIAWVTSCVPTEQLVTSLPAAG
jgi:hypothetical protein